MRTQFISVADAKRADISVTYRVKPCPKNSSPLGSLFKFCKEKFGLFVYHTNNSGIKLDPTKTTFEPLVELPVTVDRKKETHVIAIRPKAKGFYLAFLDKGACVAIYNVRVTYNYCNKNVFNTLVQFPRTVAPFDDTDVTPTEGKCVVVNSVNETQLIGYCDRTGVWNASSDVKCLCEPGFGYKETSCQG